MFNPESLIQAGGLLLIAVAVFAESGLMLGFFLPGDTLLLSAGVLAAQGKLSLIAVMAVVAAGAIAGDNTGYFIGRHAGPRLFRKKKSLIFRQEYLRRSEQFFEKYGSKTMLISHIIVVIRTFAPVVAGMSNMPYVRFAVFDAIGDVIWAVAVTFVGFWFGSRIPNISHYVLLVIILAFVISFGPFVYRLVRLRLQRRRAGRNDDSPES